MSEPTRSTDSDFPSARLRAAAQRVPPLAEHGTGTTESKVVAIELLLGVALPASLRHFVIEFGWIGAGSEIVRAIGPQQPAEECTLVRSSLLLSRNHGRPYITIGNDGGSFMYALPVKSDGTVVDRIVVLPICGGEEDEGWPEGLTFGQYVSSLIDEAEARERDNEA